MTTLQLYVIINPVKPSYKRATNNDTVRGELDSFPMLIFMLSLSIKYWWMLNK